MLEKVPFLTIASIKLRASKESTLRESIDGAISVAVETGQVIKLIFNEVKLTVTADSKPEMVIARYFDIVSQEEEL